MRDRVATAARTAGRDPESVSILPVTKGFPSARLGDVVAAGFTAVGENRVSEAQAKREGLPHLDLAYHMIGHLQRNKAAAAVRVFDRIDSVDSVRLADRLAAVAGPAGRTALPVLVQVNASGEASKGGLPIEQAVAGVERICAMANLRVRGLMTMAPIDADEHMLHEVFGRVRRCLEECRNQIAGFEGIELSMGMSGDFEIAIAEGATQIRLGTVLLGERK
ncbi:MAG: YggS family pyridoxal phosphate-dependent enzyme [Gemmatimonadota bacterium]|nr:YggS family pyridoxal phosphate-dependent enzyme [Gemmatimonadota bacterium]